MSANKVTAPSNSSAEVEAQNDPVALACDSASLDDLGESEDERAEVAAARANPIFVEGHVVSAEIARRRQQGEE